MPSVPPVATPAAAPPQTSSIFRMTLRALRLCWHSLTPIFVLLFLTQAAASYIQPSTNVEMPIAKMCQDKEDSEKIAACVDENATAILEETNALQEKIVNALPILSLLGLFLPLFYNIAAYFASLAYLRRALKTPPAASWGGYWSYLKAIMWKYTKPSLWLLIPVLGAIPYVRSLYRYRLVGPLALLDKEEPLKTSWKLTEGHVWRLIGVDAAFASLMAVAIILLAYTTVHFGADGIEKSEVVTSVLVGLTIAFWQILEALSVLAAYRVLGQEKNPL